MDIIPAIDIINGKCVRLSQGDFNQQKQYNENPLEVAQQFESAGLRRLHLVDLDGARQKKIVNHKVLENIAKNTKLKIDFGGGVQSDDDIKLAFDSGAAQVTGGSIAIRQPALFEKWLQLYGAERIILGADVKEDKIAISGWQETSDITVTSFIKGYLQKGVKYVICTDVSKDGMLAGTSIELYKHLRQNLPHASLIASGGVSNLQDLIDLKNIGMKGAIVGKALYENKINLEELKILIN
ncbi:1-(5-phosphoribosyl)-5-[(5-phosphoribosylamino)methylideneamino]imidazole-4-carboxamide isomerase [Thermoflexibacter ruber]|uniref:1-(5-phosphoribosyl)-5-[(5-phosphoribosylamino)methylideneamino] imidazole-4-carboxamide isomerase n=1 Tax=Thermoflexibacter ruber TaxID=1003 RepID=A0A1I2CGL5_9BACT|nr:1-(5-phosphoribosyl)-5-[(5-phosphoribosylamino)methylideneamino]imidazole-4-carboxamide isomerase [Thermoflexibacter ruber]SFE67394.1 1-(5-phosphoribosyl)-5-[(5-phosphoribosylamino)methylideneamino] imidazole-4-carboxamide isomerase [Thermoflexibacter ruber]